MPAKKKPRQSHKGYADLSKLSEDEQAAVYKTFWLIETRKLPNMKIVSTEKSGVLIDYMIKIQKLKENGTLRG